MSIRDRDVERFELAMASVK
ncbi:hypothetical protein C368_06735 [Cryptococcus neoformans 125.91]|nr:hypothetical protein C368_06735 [Cryptococcus neoformans var. grubii 125.91]